MRLFILVAASVAASAGCGGPASVNPKLPPGVKEDPRLNFTGTGSAPAKPAASRAPAGRGGEPK